MPEEKKDYAMMIIAVAFILLIAVVIIKIVQIRDDPGIIPMNQELMERNRELLDCQKEYMDGYQRTKFFQCKNQIGYEESTDENGNITLIPRYRTYVAYEACLKNCTPVYYPGEYNCTFYRNQPDFEKLGNITVSHEGFSNWTYYPTRWNIRDLDEFEGRYRQYKDIPLVCGYWVDENYAAARNISQTVCDDIGETQYINRSEPYDKDNYYCCFRPEGFQGNYCYPIENVTEIMTCHCEEFQT